MQALSHALASFVALELIDNMRMPAMYVIAQLLLAVPQICDATNSVFSIELEAGTFELCSKGLSFLCIITACFNDSVNSSAALNTAMLSYFFSASNTYCTSWSIRHGSHSSSLHCYDEGLTGASEHQSFIFAADTTSSDSIFTYII